MKTILLICTGNTCRSSMAEAILKDMLRNSETITEDIRVLSAGIWAIEGQGASPHSIEVLKNKNIDLSNHRSRPLTRELIEESDLILTMTGNHKRQILNAMPKAKDKVFTLKEFAEEDNLDISDPYGQSIEVYSSTAEEIEKALKKVISKLAEGE